MPTGYTEKIKDGLSFEDFVMGCAQNIVGVKIIPDVFHPTSYHREAAEEARAELEKLLAMTPEQASAEAERLWAAAEKRRLELLSEDDALRASYHKMLRKIDAWWPPTEDHVKFRKFMRDQIYESIKHDCVSEFYAAETVKQTGEEWLAGQHTKLVKDLVRHEVEYAKEIELAASRTAWVRALRASLLTRRAPPTKESK